MANRLLAALLLLAAAAHAASLSGVVYDAITREPVEGAVVYLNTTPLQRAVTPASGEYAFQAPPGNYLVSAQVWKNYSLEAFREENVSIPAEGAYRLDLIVSPEGKIAAAPERPPEYGGALVLAAILLLLIIILLYRKTRRGRRPALPRTRKVGPRTRKP